MDTYPVLWAGGNPLALVTHNLAHTAHLWHGVLGAPLVASLGTEACRPHGCDVGHGATVAFFGYHGHQVDHFATLAGTPDTRAVPCDHVSLPLPDEAALPRLLQSLLAHGCEVTAMVNHGLMRSISVPGPSQARPACLPCVLCHGRGGSHQGHGTPALMASVGGNEGPRT